jgi:hypothetical protein
LVATGVQKTYPGPRALLLNPGRYHHRTRAQHLADCLKAPPRPRRSSVPGRGGVSARHAARQRRNRPRRPELQPAAWTSSFTRFVPEMASVCELVVNRLDVLDDELAEIAEQLPDDLVAQLNAVFDAHTRALAALSDIVEVLAAEIDDLKHQHR